MLKGRKINQSCEKDWLKKVNCDYCDFFFNIVYDVNLYLYLTIQI